MEAPQSNPGLADMATLTSHPCSGKFLVPGLELQTGYHTRLTIMWVLRIQTLVLTPARRSPEPLGHPSPKPLEFPKIKSSIILADSPFLCT